MNYPKVSIIILNWNGLEDTIECLESLHKITYPDCEVILVDNGSEGNDVKVLKEKFGDYIHIIENDKNYGFAEGNNIGMRFALQNSNPDYILLLNNDTVVDPEFLTELVRVAESSPEIGIVGPKIYYYDEPDKIWFAGGKIHYHIGLAKHLGFNRRDARCAKTLMSDVKEVDYITGCSLLVKKEVLVSVGLFDSKYFFYFEDADLCTRAHRAGFTALYAPGVKIWHKASVATGKHSPFSWHHIVRSRIRFMKKFSGKATYFSFILWLIVVTISHDILRFLFLKKPSLITPYMKGILTGLREKR